MKRILALLLAVVFVLGISVSVMAEDILLIAPADDEVIKVACVGDSITQGIGASNEAVTSYPAQMAGMLGDGYEVKNFGVSKYCVLHTAVWPYWDREEYTASLDYNPDVVVIMLGTNDIKTENWVEGKDLFVGDYVELINSYKSLESKPTVFVCLPPPIFIDINDPVRPPNNLRNEALDLIRQAADETGSYVIDVFSVFDMPENQGLLTDGIHPGDAGYTLLAQTISGGITQVLDNPALKWVENVSGLKQFDDMSANLTREEFAYYIVNIFGLETDKTETVFVDVTDSEYKNDIIAAYENGIIKGVDDTHFAPKGDITRQEITVMLYRAWKVLFPEDDFDVEDTYQFTDDAEIFDWARDAVVYMYAKGIMLGTSTDAPTISPLNNIIREHALLLMTRIVENAAK